MTAKSGVCLCEVELPNREIKMFAQILTKEFLQREYTEKGKTKAQIARDVGATELTVRNYCKLHKIPTNPKRRYRSKDLKNCRFGRLVAIRMDGTDKRGKIKWLCECDCGNQITTNASSLIRGFSKSCGCWRREKLRGIDGYEDISSSYWRRLVTNAHGRNREFSITPAYVWGVFLSQGRKCVYSGLEVFFSPGLSYKCQQTASIDRIDPALGYVPGNIQIVHKVVNQMRTYLGHNEFIAFCSLIANHNKMPIDTCHLLTNRQVARKGCD